MPTLLFAWGNKQKSLQTLAKRVWRLWIQNYSLIILSSEGSATSMKRNVSWLPASNPAFWQDKPTPSPSPAVAGWLLKFRHVIPTLCEVGISGRLPLSCCGACPKAFTHLGRRDSRSQRRDRIRFSRISVLSSSTYFIPKNYRHYNAIMWSVNKNFKAILQSN